MTFCEVIVVVVRLCLLRSDIGSECDGFRLKIWSVVADSTISPTAALLGHDSERLRLRDRRQEHGILSWDNRLENIEPQCCFIKVNFTPPAAFGSFPSGAEREVCLL